MTRGPDTAAWSQTRQVSWELYRARQENRLATGGLYPLVRHPQYTGLFPGLFGEGVVHWPTLFSLALFPVIVLVYGLLARSEENRVLEQFGDACRAYRRRVPMFIPRIGQWGEIVECSGRKTGDAGRPARPPLSPSPRGDESWP